MSIVKVCPKCRKKGRHIIFCGDNKKVRCYACDHVYKLRGKTKYDFR